MINKARKIVNVEILLQDHAAFATFATRYETVDFSIGRAGELLG